MKIKLELLANLKVVSRLTNCNETSFFFISYETSYCKYVKYLKKKFLQLFSNSMIRIQTYGIIRFAGSLESINYCVNYQLKKKEQFRSKLSLW